MAVNISVEVKEVNRPHTASARKALGWDSNEDAPEGKLYTCIECILSAAFYCNTSHFATTDKGWQTIRLLHVASLESKPAHSSRFAANIKGDLRKNPAVHFLTGSMVLCEHCNSKTCNY